MGKKETKERLSIMIIMIIRDGGAGPDTETDLNSFRNWSKLLGFSFFRTNFLFFFVRSNN